MYVTKRKNLAANDRKGLSTENESFLLLESGDSVFSYYTTKIPYIPVFDPTNITGLLKPAAFE